MDCFADKWHNAIRNSIFEIFQIKPRRKKNQWKKAIEVKATIDNNIWKKKKYNRSMWIFMQIYWILLVAMAKAMAMVFMCHYININLHANIERNRDIKLVKLERDVEWNRSIDKEKFACQLIHKKKLAMVGMVWAVCWCGSGLWE